MTSGTQISIRTVVEALENDPDCDFEDIYSNGILKLALLAKDVLIDYCKNGIPLYYVNLLENDNSWNYVYSIEAGRSLSYTLQYSTFLQRAV